jgi:hypothetical protein
LGGGARRPPQAVQTAIVHKIEVPRDNSFCPPRRRVGCKVRGKKMEEGPVGLSLGRAKLGPRVEVDRGEVQGARPHLQQETEETAHEKGLSRRVLHRAIRKREKRDKTLCQEATTNEDGHAPLGGGRGIRPKRSELLEEREKRIFGGFPEKKRRGSDMCLLNENYIKLVFLCPREQKGG